MPREHKGSIWCTCIATHSKLVTFFLAAVPQKAATSQTKNIFKGLCWKQMMFELFFSLFVFESLCPHPSRNLQLHLMIGLFHINEREMEKWKKTFARGLPYDHDAVKLHSLETVLMCNLVDLKWQKNGQTVNWGPFTCSDKKLQNWVSWVRHMSDLLRGERKTNRENLSLDQSVLP